MTSDNGVYHVDSGTMSDATYRVSFDNGKGMPECQCFDWSRYHMPCKHMLAIIASGKKTWDQFPDDYKNNPFINLDVSQSSTKFLSPSGSDVCEQPEVSSGTVDATDDAGRNESQVTGPILFYM